MEINFFLGTSLSRPPPKEKPVGRPMKPYTLEKAYEDMNKCHDFWKMVDYYKSYDLQVDQRKAEMRLHYSTTGNFREKARAFNLNESTVRGIIKTHPVAGRMILSKKQNFPGELS